MDFTFQKLYELLRSKHLQLSIYNCSFSYLWISSILNYIGSSHPKKNPLQTMETALPASEIKLTGTEEMQH